MAPSTSPRLPAALRRVIDPLARFGFAARGGVYVAIGYIAARAAVRGRRPTDAEGALRMVGQQAHGEVLLAVLGLGLAAYAVWRVAQAVYDLDAKGGGPKGLGVRASYLGSGVIHLGLALTAMGLLVGAPGGGRQNVRAWVARALSEPMGEWAVALAGAATIGTGVFHLYKAYRSSFEDRLETGRVSARGRRWVSRIARLGLSARGATLMGIGWFLIRAATTERAGEARGLAEALRALQQQTWGPWFLAAVAMGLVAYGLFSFVCARYRRIVT